MLELRYYKSKVKNKLESLLIFTFLKKSEGSVKIPQNYSK